MKREVGTCKKQKNRKLAVKLSLLEISEKLHHDVSPAWMPKTDINKDDRNRYSSWDGGRGTQEGSTLDEDLQATKEGRV